MKLEIYVCDRCGVRKESDHNVLKVVKHNSMETELCGDCYKAFYNLENDQALARSEFWQGGVV